MAGENVFGWSTTALTNGSVDSSINFQEGQLPSTVNNSARSVMAAIARYVKDNGALTTTGSANAYLLTVNGTYAALATGLRLAFKASFANSGAATLAVTAGAALTAKALRKYTGSGDSALASGNIIQDAHYLVEYDAAANSAAGAWIVLNPTLVGADVTGAALTKTDDTNVTLTLGGTPTTSLLRATSITLGWTGTLQQSRGGFGADVSAVNGVPLFTTGTATFTSTSGSGNFVRVTSATLVTPALGTPSSVTLTNATGLPIGSGVSGLGTGVATLLGGTSSGTGGPAGTASPTFTGTAAFVALTTSGDASVTGNFAVNTSKFTVTGTTGATTISASSATAFTVTQATGNLYTALLTGASTSGQSYGVNIRAGTNSSDVAFTVNNQGNTQNFLTITGAGVVTVSQSTASTDTTHGALVVTGGVGIGGALNVGGLATVSQLATSISPVTGWSIDNTGATTTANVANGSNVALTAGSGLIMVRDGLSGNIGLYMLDYNTGVLIYTSNTTWVSPTTTPGAGKMSIAYNGSVYAIYNNQGSATNFQVFSIRMGPLA